MLLRLSIRICRVKGIALTREYTEWQAFCPVVRTGSSPLTRERVMLLPFGSKGETHSLAVEGGGRTQLRRQDRNSGDLYTIIPVQPWEINTFEVSRTESVLSNFKMFFYLNQLQIFRRAAYDPRFILYQNVGETYILTDLMRSGHWKNRPVTEGSVSIGIL
jgi:hypothetical protein